MKIFHARQTDPVHFQLNLTKRVLSRQDGKPIEKNLPDQEMRLLCYFVEHPGELLTRDQLQKVGWGARQMATDTVDKAVSEIRAALGDNRTDQLFIQTVRPSRDQPGPRGYRFVAEFEPAPPNGEHGKGETILPESGHPITKSRAKEILQALPESVRETLEGIFFLIDLRDAPGSEDNPRKLLRRFQQKLSNSGALAPDVVNQIGDDFQFAIDTQGRVLYTPGFSGTDVTRAMIEPALEYLSREEECFRRIGAFGTDVAVSFLTEHYSLDELKEGGHHSYHAYGMQLRILQHFLDHDYGLAILPFAAFLLVTESPNRLNSASAEIFRLAEGIAKNAVGGEVAPAELARQYPFVDPPSHEGVSLESHDANAQTPIHEHGANGDDATNGPNQRLKFKVTGESLRFKLSWNRPPYTVWTIHTDQPLFENYPGDWFYRGMLAKECPNFYRQILAGPGITSVSRSGPYAVSLGTADLAEPNLVAAYVMDIIRSEARIANVSYSLEPPGGEATGGERGDASQEAANNAVSAPSVEKSDVSVGIHIGYFENGNHHASEFAPVVTLFQQACFEAGFYNCSDRFHCGGPFSVIQHWGVPSALVDEIKMLADESLLHFGITADSKPVRRSRYTDGRPNVTFVVGAKEISLLRHALKENGLPPVT